ncbi:MAG: IS21 family transposase [Gemmatimonadetes bacterium]|nr:IS21 family transposase [Gemmatimonadota bacterium]
MPRRGLPGRLLPAARLVGTLRPASAPVVRFETAPGEQAQVDFAHCRLPWGIRYALIVVLGYSRLLWVRFYPRQDLRTLQHGLAACLDDWGGVPRHLLFDQMRSVLTRDDRLAGGGLLTNPECQRFAQHYGFRLRVCRPYRAQTKGKVERPIRYLRGSFLYGRTFVSDADLNAQVAHWLDTVANPRVHGTTGVVAAVRFLPRSRRGCSRCRCGPMCRSCRPHAPCPRVRSRCPRLSWSTGASPPTRRSRGWRHDPPRAHRPVTPRARPGAARRSQDARRPRGARRRAPAL